jgi:hypothetical protein
MNEDKKNIENKLSNLLKKLTEEFLESLLLENSEERNENIKLQSTFLIKHLSNNDKSIQKLIYYSLTINGIKGILNEINESKIEKIRKLCVQLLINLLYNNLSLQIHFCEIFNFTPITNVICINFLPKIFREKITMNEDILYEIRKSQNYINPNLKYWMWPYNDKYNKDYFPDPNKYLIGFYMENKISIFFPEKKLNNKKIINQKEIIEILEREKIKNKNLTIKKTYKDNNDFLLTDRLNTNINERLFTTRDSRRKLAKSLDYQNYEFKEFISPSTVEERTFNNNFANRKISIERKIPPSIKNNIVIRYKTLTVAKINGK